MYFLDSLYILYLIPTTHCPSFASIHFSRATHAWILSAPKTRDLTSFLTFYRRCTAKLSSEYNHVVDSEGLIVR